MIRHARKSNNNSIFQEILFYSSGICSFFYYFFDNLIWMSKNRYKALSRIKDLFSFSRCLIGVYISLYEIASDLQKEE